MCHLDVRATEQKKSRCTWLPKIQSFALDFRQITFDSGAPWAADLTASHRLVCLVAVISPGRRKQPQEPGLVAKHTWSETLADLRSPSIWINGLMPSQPGHKALCGFRPWVGGRAERTMARPVLGPFPGWGYHLIPPAKPETLRLLRGAQAKRDPWELRCCHS